MTDRIHGDAHQNLSIIRFRKGLSLLVVITTNLYREDLDLDMTHPLFSKLDQRVVDCGKRNRPDNAVTVVEIILQTIGNDSKVGWTFKKNAFSKTSPLRRLIDGDDDYDEDGYDDDK